MGGVLYFFAKVLIKFTFYFLLSYIILSIPIGERPFFYHVHSYWGPYIENIWIGGLSRVSGNKEVLKRPFIETSKAAKKFFSNTLPEEKTEKKKQPSSVRKVDKYEETYTVEEKQFLEKILRESR